jgi:RNA polymerase sigma-70 factor (ECF subfamily)
MSRHEDRIFTLALKMTGNRADALDATQDAFITLFKNASKFRGDSAFSTWLYRIAINACNDLLRKRSRLRSVDEPISEETAAVGPLLDDIVVTHHQLAEALRQIPGEYREAVLMHDLLGLPYEDIAAETGVPLGTVKSRISRGRKGLASLLEQAEGRATSKEVR